MKIIRATKIQALEFIRRKDLVWSSELVERYGYSPATARKKLWRLEKQGLVEKVTVDSEAYCLTVEAHRRLAYYDRRV